VGSFCVAAIARVDAFYKKQGRHAAGIEVIAGFWGYGMKSSSFMVSLAAMLKKEEEIIICDSSSACAWIEEICNAK
jgi:hypothetical protein